MPKLSPGLVALGFVVSLSAPQLGAQPVDPGTGGGDPREPIGRPAEPFAGADRLDRESLVAAVLARNPSLEAARQAWRAANERVAQAASLEDPTAAYSLAPASLAAPNVDFGQVLQVGQRFPYPGTLRRRGEAAAAEAEAAGHDLAALRVRLATAASLRFDDYYLVARSLAINEEHLRLLDDFKRIATARYAAGQAAQQDPLQAEVELVHLHHRRVVLEADRREVTAGINALLHRPPEAALPPPPAELAPPPTAVEPGEELQAEALARRPELRAEAARVRNRESNVALRRLDLYPDFEAVTSYNSMWNTPEHRWMVGVGIRLPLRRGRLRAGVAEAEARLMEEESEGARLADEVLAQVVAAEARLAESRHAVELYRSRLLPASRDQVAAALAGFRSGGNSFLALIEAEKNLRTSELEYERAVTDVYRRGAELDHAVGRIPGDGAAPRDSEEREETEDEP